MIISKPTPAHVTYRLLRIICKMDSDNLDIKIGSSYVVKSIGNVFLVWINANYKCKKYAYVCLVNNINFVFLQDDSERICLECRC